MQKQHDSFRHESLQDSATIQDILKSISKGLGKGKLTFSDEDGEIIMQPEGLLDLKVTANQDESRYRLNIRISWQADEKVKKKTALSVNKNTASQNKK